MAFTYLLGTNRGKVRLLVPDTNSEAYELEDEEIDYFLTVRGNNVKAAAVDACRWLSRKYAQQANWTADGVQFSGATRAEQYAQRAAELAAEMAGGIASLTLDRTDGYSEEASKRASEYEHRIIYVRTR